MTTLATDLHLHEQLLLLALRDRKGTPESGSEYRAHALGGAILAELALTGCIRIDEGRRAVVEEVPGADRPRNAILAEAFGLVRNRRRRRRASGWVSTFAGIRDLWHRTALGLCGRGVLRKSESQVLLVFSRRTYPTLDPGPERDLLRRMREAIVGDGEIEAGLGAIAAPRVARVVEGAEFLYGEPGGTPCRELLVGRIAQVSGQPRESASAAVR